MLNVLQEQPLNVVVMRGTWLARMVSGSTSRVRAYPVFLPTMVLLLAQPQSKLGTPVVLNAAGMWGVHVIVSAEKHFHSLQFTVWTHDMWRH